MTVKIVMEKLDEIGGFLDDITMAVTTHEKVRWDTGDLELLSDVLTEYRDMLLEMKAKTN